MSDSVSRDNAQLGTDVPITFESIREAALCRYVALRPIVWVHLPAVEPDVAVRVALAYGGLPAYDADIPVGVARVVERLYPDWPFQRRVDLVRAVVGCGTLTAWHAVNNLGRKRRQRRKGGA